MTDDNDLDNYKTSITLGDSRYLQLTAQQVKIMIDSVF